MDDRIDRLQRICAQREGVLGLAGGLPAAELFPRKLLASAFVSAVSGDGLQYGWPEGSEGLRRWIAGRLAARGADVSADDVIVTSGAQQALAIATDLARVSGARIGVDRETYPGALDLFRARGAETVTDGDVRCFYVVAGASNPRGAGLSAERRSSLLASGKLLVVDEAYAELRFDGRQDPPIIAEARDRVLHVGTFSKTLCPGLRVGWLVPPRAMRADAVRMKRDADLQAGSLAQSVLEAYLATGDYDARVRRAQKMYASRAARLASALRRELGDAVRFDEPEGGFALFVETDLVGVDEARALAVATDHGVSFDPASSFRASGARDPLGMRLSCSSLAGDELDEAVRRLAAVIRALSAADDRARRRGA